MPVPAPPFSAERPAHGPFRAVPAPGHAGRHRAGSPVKPAPQRPRAATAAAGETPDSPPPMHVCGAVSPRRLLHPASQRRRQVARSLCAAQGNGPRPLRAWPKPRAGGGIHRPGPHPYRGPMPGWWSVSACISQARRVNHFPILTLAPSVPLHDQPRPAVSAEGPLAWSLGPRFVPRPVPGRPAPRRRLAVDHHVARAVLAGGRGGGQSTASTDRDQARAPLVPVRAPFRVTPPVRTLHPHGTIRTRVRYAKTPGLDRNRGSPHPGRSAPQRAEIGGPLRKSGGSLIAGSHLTGLPAVNAPGRSSG